MLGEAAGVLIGELVCGSAESKQIPVTDHFVYFSPTIKVIHEFRESVAIITIYQP